ncbi:Zn-ribbon-containing, possibly RNA-binding protein and truncated derivatives [Treponema sp. R8-4-B8]
MKTAGEIFSTLFDEQFMKKAQKYSKFFDSWKDITAKNGIAAAADHSRIKDLDRGLLLIETDHPGWKQILQTKQSKLLNDFRIRFPELEISSIALILGKSEPDSGSQNSKPQEIAHKTEIAEEPSQEVISQSAVTGLDAIKDEEFKETLKRLGQSIAMKNIVKLFGIIAFVAVIVFSIAACGDDGDNSGSNVLTVDNVQGTWTYTFSSGGYSYVSFNVTERNDNGYAVGTLGWGFNGTWVIGEDTTDGNIVKLKCDITYAVISDLVGRYSAVLSNGGKTMTLTRFEGTGVETFTLTKGQL